MWLKGGSRDLLGAFLEGHTQALLESQDLLQVPTQSRTVCAAQPRQKPHYQLA